ncbi:MAG: GTPase Era [Legionella sp.]|nr:GTPase Era [Legionella sp.]
MTTNCGYIALVGRPNVGKSTLLNRILEQKLSITARKPQTTRYRILGVKTIQDHQYLYVDTPGLHQGSKKIMNRLMNQTTQRVLQEVDVIVLVVEALRWEDDDALVLQQIKHTKTPCILVLNKVDKVNDKGLLLPWLQRLQALHSFEAIVPLSAKTGLQVAQLESALKPYLPSGPHLFDADALTDRSMRFICAELLREKIFRLYGQELPYATAVEIEAYEETADLVRIHALIWVDKANHKRILIGAEGKKLKLIATQARLEMERLTEKKVYLACWCKVKPGWGDNDLILKQLGYGH